MSSNSSKLSSLPARLDGVQILRGAAAAAVAWHHALETSKGIGYALSPPDWLVLCGASGVDIFFVVSGFIMVYICARRDDAGSAGASVRFLVNRFKRIYPLYWCCCAVFLLAIAAGYFHDKTLGVEDIVASLMLWPSDERIIGISWTLSYEVYFYIIFAVSLFARNVRRAVLATGGFIVAVTFVSALMLGSDAFMASPIVVEFVFGMGVGLAYVSGRLHRILLAPGTLAALAVAMLLTASMIFYSGTTHHLPGHVRFLAWGLPSVLLLVAALTASDLRHPLHRLGARIGDASYAIYLFHPLVLIVYAKAFQKVSGLAQVSQWVWVPIVTVGCIVTGWLAHAILERPFARLIAGPQRIRVAAASA